MTLNIQILRSLTVVSTQNISCANFDETFLFIIAWVKRVIDSKELTSIVTTSLEIRKLVQAFLHARSLVVLPRRCIVPQPLTSESQESQDEFGKFDLDLDDPELINALENNGDSLVADDRRLVDARVAKVSS